MHWWAPITTHLCKYTMRLWVTGGGGCLVKNFGKVNSKRITFEEDICAAAKGYEYLANVQLSAGIGL